MIDWTSQEDVKGFIASHPNSASFCCHGKSGSFCFKRLEAKDGLLQCPKHGLQFLEDANG